MENVYKNDFLKDIGTHAELLVYDWSNGGEIELVVEDIEKIGVLFSTKTTILQILIEKFSFQILIVLKENHQKCKIGVSSTSKRTTQKLESNTPMKLLLHILTLTYHFSIAQILSFNQRTLLPRTEFLKR